MQRFEEGQLGKIHAAARNNVENRLDTASDADKQIFVQVECTKLIVAAVENLDIQGAKAEVIAEIRKIPKVKQSNKRQLGGLMGLSAFIGGAVAEFISRLRGG